MNSTAFLTARRIGQHWMSCDGMAILQTRLLRIYRQLLKEFGHRGWWPGETRFEIMIGAILTQNTNWGNVEKAISGLKSKGLLEPEALADSDVRQIEKAIRSSGYFRQKAGRIKGFAKYLVENYDGDLDSFFSKRLAGLREELLSLNGIGPETADSILLYAGEKPVFVVDAYTKRIFGRLGLVGEDAGYEEVQRFFEKGLPEDVELYKDFHAQIVELGKRFCKKGTPLCRECPLRKECKQRSDLYSSPE